MKYSFIPVVQYKNNFSGSLVSNNGLIGGMGKDDEGLYINLKKQLSLSETVELIQYIKSIGEFDLLNLKIQYKED